MALELSKEIRVKDLIVYTDSQLVDGEINRTYEVRNDAMKLYLEKAKVLMSHFEKATIEKVGRDDS